MRFKSGILKRYAGILLLMPVLCSPRLQTSTPEKLAIVGDVPVAREDVSAFKFVSRYRQNDDTPYQLEGNGSVWALLATEALYQHGMKKPEIRQFRQGTEWEWRRRSYISVAFERQILQANCGYSDLEVKNYFKRHRTDFRPVTYSENGAACTSKVVPPFDSIRADVAKRLFLSEYHHDSGSLDLRHPRGFRMFRERLYRDHFMKRYYQETYGKNFDDTLIHTLCGAGDGAVITENDLNIVLSWLPADERAIYTRDPDAIIRRMVQWKLFSRKAETTGYTKRHEVRLMLDWALKREIAERVITEILLPKVEKNVFVDDGMARFSYWDSVGKSLPSIDPAIFTHYLHQLVVQKKKLSLDSLIYHLRCVQGVKFLKPDIWSDERIKKASVLKLEADALRDSGQTTPAQTLYHILTEYYLFTSEGKRALVDLAEIEAEENDANKRDAIRNFRRFLILTDDPKERGEIMFRIAFVYDRGLHRPDMAERNYRWVTDHAPDCGFADDAEVMLRHLGELLPEPEVLRAEDEAKDVPSGN